jgi:RNA polymerase sigma-70 factor, ECF subfamily
MSDEELIWKIKQGDKTGFRGLVMLYHTMVINTCFGFLHNKEDAEDVAQEVFMDVFRSLTTFRFQSKLSTWIYRIAINKSINYLRKTKVRQTLKSLEPAYKENDPAFQVPTLPSDLPTEILDNQEMAYILHNAIDSLPENQRSAFVLHKYEDLAYKEISEIMGMSLSAVESLIHRAKLNLQKKLISYYKINHSAHKF